MIEDYCRWLSRHFFVIGMDPEDVYQEAWLAAWRAPDHPRLAARRQVFDLMKIGQRRRFEPMPHEQRAETDVAETVERRDLLRRILSAPRTPNEREALLRRLHGEPIRRGEHALDMAWYRLSARLAA